MYDYELSEKAEGQLLRLPYEVAIAAVDVLAAALVDPWNYQRREDEPLDRHHAHRWVRFDGDRGRLWFLVRDGEGLLWVTEIQWPVQSG